MSKSAIKSLSRANEIIAVLGLTVGVPANWMNDEQARANFKNADLLACLIINSAANCLQCETVDTLDASMYDDMQQAVEGYIQSNLDCWNQKEWPESCRDVKEQLARLAEMVSGQLAYNARQKAHAEALEVNEAVDKAIFQATIFADNDNLDLVCRREAIDSIRRQLLDMNRYPARFIVKMMTSVRRLAIEAREKAKAHYREMLARPAVEGIDSDIPF